MNAKNIEIILNLVTVKCPLCKFTCKVKRNVFKCRERYSLRHHLHKEHTELEIEKYVKRKL